MHIMLIFFLAFAAVSAVPTPIKNYDFRNFYHGSPTSAAPIDEMNKGKVMLRIVGPFEVNCGSHGCYFDNTKSKFTHLEATVTIESGAYSILTWIYLEEYENTGDVFIKIENSNNDQVLLRRTTNKFISICQNSMITLQQEVVKKRWYLLLFAINESQQLFAIVRRKQNGYPLLSSKSLNEQCPVTGELTIQAGIFIVKIGHIESMKYANLYFAKIQVFDQFIKSESEAFYQIMANSNCPQLLSRSAFNCDSFFARFSFNQESISAGLQPDLTDNGSQLTLSDDFQINKNIENQAEGIVLQDNGKLQFSISQPFCDFEITSWVKSQDLLGQNFNFYSFQSSLSFYDKLEVYNRKICHHSQSVESNCKNVNGVTFPAPPAWISISIGRMCLLKGNYLLKLTINQNIIFTRAYENQNLKEQGGVLFLLEGFSGVIQSLEFNDQVRTPEYFSFYDSSYPQCSQSQYFVNGSCKSCDSGPECLFCKNSALTAECLTSNSFADQLLVQKCPLGFYSTSTSCYQCQGLCEECYGLANPNPPTIDVCARSQEYFDECNTECKATCPAYTIPSGQQCKAWFPEIESLEALDQSIIEISLMQTAKVNQIFLDTLKESLSVVDQRGVTFSYTLNPDQPNLQEITKIQINITLSEIDLIEGRNFTIMASSDYFEGQKSFDTEININPQENPDDQGNDGSGDGSNGNGDGTDNNGDGTNGEDGNGDGTGGNGTDNNGDGSNGDGSGDNGDGSGDNGNGTNGGDDGDNGDNGNEGNNGDDGNDGKDGNDGNDGNGEDNGNGGDDGNSGNNGNNGDGTNQGQDGNNGGDNGSNGDGGDNNGDNSNNSNDGNNDDNQNNGNSDHNQNNNNNSNNTGNNGQNSQNNQDSSGNLNQQKNGEQGSDFQDQMKLFQDLVQGHYITLTSAIALNFAINAGLDASLKYLWGFINMIQLIEFLLSLCQPKPFNVIMLLQSLNFANSDFAFLEPLGEHMTQELEIQVTGEYQNPQNSCLEGGGFQTQSFYDNSSLKLTFFMLWFMVIVPVTHFTARVFKKCKCRQFAKRLRSGIKWTSFYRIFLQFYAELAITAFMGMFIVNFDNPSNIMDFAVRYFFLALLLGIPIYLIIAASAYKKKYRELDKKEHSQKMWIILQDVQFFFHRLCFASILVLVPPHRDLRVYLLLALYVSEIIVVTLPQLRPLFSKKERIEFLLEYSIMAVLILLIVVFKYTHGKISERAFINIGYVFCGIVVAAFVRALISLLIESIYNCRAKCKKKQNNDMTVKIKPLSLKSNHKITESEDRIPNSARQLSLNSQNVDYMRGSTKQIGFTTQAEEGGMPNRIVSDLSSNEQDYHSFSSQRMRN